MLSRSGARSEKKEVVEERAFVSKSKSMPKCSQTWDRVSPQISQEHSEALLFTQQSLETWRKMLVCSNQPGDPFCKLKMSQLPEKELLREP